MTEPGDERWFCTIVCLYYRLQEWSSSECLGSLGYGSGQLKWGVEGSWRWLFGRVDCVDIKVILNNEDLYDKNKLTQYNTQFYRNIR